MAALSSHLAKSRFKRISPHVIGDVLDIGCQQGQLYEKLRDQITSYTGIDLSSLDIQNAKKNHPNCAFKQLDLDNEPLTFQNQFDTIVMSAVIEHIFNLKFLGEGLAAALKPNGKVILTTPTNFGNDVVHKLGCSLGLFSKEAADDHITIFNRKRLDIFGKEIGLDLIDYKTFQFGCNQIAILRK
jgi:SAM-dependent methyltransferase